MIPHRRHALGLLTLVALAVPSFARAQAVSDQDRMRAHDMLDQIRKDLTRYYYDSTFGGVDLAARFHVADSSIREAGTFQEVYGVVAQFVMDLKDSHTNFIPPRHAATVDYGWGWIIIGDQLFVRSVRKDSDAEKKGLAVGDRVAAIDGMLPNRQTMDVISYLYFALSPRTRVHVTVQKPDGTVRELDIDSKVTPEQRVIDYTSFADVSRLIDQSETASHARRHWWRAFGDSVLVWHFRSFRYMDEGIDEMMDRARHFKTLVMDLRNNGGGAEVTIQRLIGHFYDHDVRIGTIRERDRRYPLMASRARREPFTGNLIVLVNSNSASAAEITTRFLQLDGRATVVGDRSAGAVMGARTFSHQTGFSKYVAWAIQITGQDIIMPDEGRLENVGVMPEFIVLPTGADMVAKRDPQMAKALQLAGIQMTPEDAAKIFEVRP